MPRRRGVVPGGPVHRALERVIVDCDVKRGIASDPIEYVHRQTSVADQELVALIAASVAFGNVKALRGKLHDALERIGPVPSAAADDPVALGARLESWRHRVWRGDDLARMIVGARRVQRAAGSLGQRFADDLAASGGSLREALARFVAAIRRDGGLDRVARRGARHLLADPRGASGCKRLLLFLRWMVRGPDGVDLGLWRAHVATSALLIPVDVHIHKLARNLRLTERPTPSWRTTEEITASLRALDPLDPVRFDFALCHMGMVRRCPSRRDAVRCDGCGVRPVCRWWPSAGAPPSASSRPSPP
ncbi:MAG: TIGR02757 family protein [Polyangiales bacterium]